MKTALFIVSIALGIHGGVASAHDENMAGHAKAAGGSAPSDKITPELKKDMADMYQKMATCLRTDKSLTQCSQEAMISCPVVEKTGHCPINEGIGTMTGGPSNQPSRGMGMGNMKHGDSKASPGDPARHGKKADEATPDKKSPVSR